jgi:hypothetical protein
MTLCYTESFMHERLDSWNLDQVSVEPTFLR